MFKVTFTLKMTPLKWKNTEKIFKFLLMLL